MYGNMQISFRDAHTVLEKLIKDKYVENFLDSTGCQRYYITFDGAVFIHNGGYTVSAKDHLLKEKAEFAKTNLMILGSWMAGIGTLLLVCVEMLKHLGWAISINLLTVCFLIFSGVVVGVLISLTISEVKAVRQQEQ